MRAEYREEPCRSALTAVKGMPFPWSLNPYMGCVHRCTFCYVRAFERRADRPSDDRYGRSIRVKTNIVEVLRQELGRPRWKHEQVTIGSATDPYQPAEGTYRLTRGCIETLARARNPFVILTRGPLILRDIDVLQHASARAEVAVNVSIPTLDEEVWRRTEPGTAPPRQRLRAVRAMSEAGIRVAVAVAPVLPGISDKPEQLEAVVAAARKAGATALWCRALNLRPGVREHFLAGLAREWPDLLPAYRELYATPYLPRNVAREIEDGVGSLRDRLGIADRREHPIVPAPAPRQLTLL